ncbi:MAG: metal ABC transporter permease [Puniceicoccaceae bacterium]|nr:MAG: metal ABC transporter permease [Puniceicoccaceae bacterium]
MSRLDLIPAFSVDRVFIEPWRDHADTFFWIALMGFFVTTACGLVGTFLVWRRMALVGDAISHSILPGIVIAFFLAQTRATTPLFIGALVAAGLTVWCIEAIHHHSRIKPDAALGIVFSSFFAVGIILLTLFADSVDLDADCVLFGEIGFLPLEDPVVLGGLFLGPLPLVRMGAVLVGILLLLALVYRPLVLASFDPGLARILGFGPRGINFGLMAVLAITVVSAFESVGAILVVAMLIFPPATGSLLSDRMPVILAGNALVAAVSALGGLHLAIWLEASIAACMVCVAGAVFGLAWLLSPRRGLLRRRPPLSIPFSDPTATPTETTRPS